ncbi:MAG: Gfo/Idh/MocA family oxidoreductase [Candidatus Aminicenantes bacterium]|nr:Gfo/Idh/MocA family oxidoreductase [Candidatus Aminicenantes bacterium]
MKFRNDISIGIAGCGVALVHHLLALKNVPGVRILWFCDPDGKRAEEAKRLWGKQSRTGPNFEKLLGEETPDVVHICTPPAFHAGTAFMAFEAGSHVLLEKPMAQTVAEAKKILEARDRSGRKLCVVHNHMFDPPILRLKKLAADGKLGRLFFGRGCYFLDSSKMAHEKLDQKGHWVHRLKSGIAGEFMPHTLYLLQAFFGPVRKLDLLYDNGLSEGGKPDENLYSLQMRFAGGLGQVFMADRMPYGHFSFSFYGTKAAAHVNMMDLTLSVEKIRHSLPLPAARMASTVEQSFQKLGWTALNIFQIGLGKLKRRPGHRLLIKKFYEALRGKGRVPVSGEEGLMNVKALELLNKAMAAREKDSGE